ncbi:MAG: tetratricopeptide repeat protein [Sphingomonadaceae bacterium]|nr:tetratricopeptide repeat protein [Sphingomonadaceae bacterium]
MTFGIGPTGSAAQVAALQQQVNANPADRIARHNLAVELRKCGQAEQALAQIERTWAEGLRLPETATMRGHLLADAGRFDEALAAYREAVRVKPELVEAHAAMASLLPQLGRGSEALDSLRDALKRAPQAGILWLEAMALARGHMAWDQLLDWAEAAEQRFGADTMVTAFAANALSGLDRDDEALARMDAALAIEPTYTPGHAIRAHIFLRKGDPAAAAEAAEQATHLSARDQSAWALLSIAWRLLGDEREHWLCDYDNLVMPIDIGLDEDLPGVLEALHRVGAHPADQSLRGGTQTRGNLFEANDPVIHALAQVTKAAIEERIGQLTPDDSHPFLSRITGKSCFPTSWSVRLAASGFHVSHIHPAGWLSSAYYASLPPEVAAGDGQGALAFGVPDAALGLDLAPRRVVQPREGQLVLFPSYLWHGTTPFESSAPRLTVAFDALPVDNGGQQG